MIKTNLALLSVVRTRLASILASVPMAQVAFVFGI